MNTMRTHTASSDLRTAERRRFPRAQWEAELPVIYLDAKGRRVMTTLRSVDISRSGLGVLSGGEHNVGEHFVLCLPEPSGRTHYVHARVVRCIPQEDITRLGLEFSDTPSDLGCWLNARFAA